MTGYDIENVNDAVMWLDRVADAPSATPNLPDVLDGLDGLDVAAVPAAAVPGTPAVPEGRGRGRPSGWTKEKQKEFFRALMLTGSVQRAADHVRLSASSAYRLRLHPDAHLFRHAWMRATDAMVANLKSVAFDRAINGTPTLVYRDGQLVSQKIAPSDRLIFQLLEKYDTPCATADGVVAQPSANEEMAVHALTHFLDRLDDLPDPLLDAG